MKTLTLTRHDLTLLRRYVLLGTRPASMSPRGEYDRALFEFAHKILRRAINEGVAPRWSDLYGWRARHRWEHASGGVRCARCKKRMPARGRKGPCVLPETA